MTIRFTVPQDIGDAIEYEAAARGQTRSEYARTATIAYMNKYPSKGVVAEIVAARCTDPINIGSQGESHDS